MRLTVEVQRQFAGGPLIQAALDLDLDRFGITVLFGPSGCGKTTLLRLISGLERPDGGQISLDGAVWSRGARWLPAHHRRVGYVFQEGALFPHLSVAANIAFGLGRGSTHAGRVADLVRRLGLAGLEHRRPGELSGGQKQRVALARALAPRPRLVLLDEPFASLDRPAAEGLRHELRAMLKAEGLPALLVTHDRAEALSLGDRLLRMEAGRIVEAGRPEDVLTGLAPELDQGGTESVVRARVVGRKEGLLCLEVGSARLFAPDPGGEFSQARLCIRSEGVSLEREGGAPVSARNHLPARVVALDIRGALARVRLDCGFPLESLVTAWACRDLGLGVGDPVTALVKATAIQVVPVDGEA
ncbi:MAG: ABC transporter ATP-binding protein [Geothrix sp.]|nr:ABC transporter ATP-binding protein [Geothrix sp.]